MSRNGGTQHTVIRCSCTVVRWIGVGGGEVGDGGGVVGGGGSGEGNIPSRQALVCHYQLPKLLHLAVAEVAYPDAGGIIKQHLDG